MPWLLVAIWALVVGYALVYLGINGLGGHKIPFLQAFTGHS